MFTFTEFNVSNMFQIIQNKWGGAVLKRLSPGPPLCDTLDCFKGHYYTAQEHQCKSKTSILKH